MQLFKNILAVSALASVAFAQTVAPSTITFVNQDSVNRTIIITAAFEQPEMEPVLLGGYETKLVNFTDGWSGNFFAIPTEGGDPLKTGMLGEVTFAGVNGWKGITFFDISAIVNPNDIDNVKEIFPKASNTPLAGCQEFPCDNAYNVWNDDLATKGTSETELVCLIGNLESTQRRRHATSHASYHKRRAAAIGKSSQ